MLVRNPTCTIIAGPNGAGKTTFALAWVREIGGRNFVNADLIASGLSPLAPEQERIAASRIFLTEIRRYIRKREDFCFETTLAGKTYLSLIHQMLTGGWQVELYYLWLPNVNMSIQRVAERVKHGGHNIPLEDMVRRYPRSLINLLDHYAPLCSSTTCMDNSGREAPVIFVEDATGRLVENQKLYNALLLGAGHD
jgi:predicted ABC-type ATPase